MRRGISGSFVGLLFFFSAAWCASYHLTPEGTDEGDCSAAAPCATLGRVTELLGAQDTLYVLAGADAASWLDGLFDAGELATSRYGGLVLQDSTERRQVRGFVRLATTWGTHLKPNFPSAARAIPNLVDALNAQTRISASVGAHLFIGSPGFFRSPFVYITAATAFEMTESEIKGLGRYLREGGFVFADNGLSAFEHSQTEAAMRHLFRAALGRAGRLRRIPDNHPIYHCFYDFDGPPPGLDEATQSYYLEGIFLNGRLVGVFADQGYVHSWAQSFGNEPQLRFGINAVVFALTQPGSISPKIHFFTRHSE